MTNIVVRTIDCHITYLKDDAPKFLMLKRSPQKMYGEFGNALREKLNLMKNQ